MRSTWKTQAKINGVQEVPRRNITRKLPRRGRRSRKGGNIIIHQPLHTSANIHCNHCNIDVHTKEKCWELHPNLNLKNHKKDRKKKNLLATYLNNQVESGFDVDENIVCTYVKNKVNLSILHHQEEKELTKLFHIKIQVKKTKIDALFNSGSKDNLIAGDLVRNIGLKFHDHLIPYPLGWVNKDAKIKVTKQCKIKFVVSFNFIDEVELDLVPLDVCRLVFGSPYMYMRDFIFMQKSNQYNLVKDQKTFIINAHKGK
jgi:hypothetical protein